VKPKPEGGTQASRALGGAYTLHADQVSAALRIVVEIQAPPSAETEAWRRRQVAGLRSFLQAVQENRVHAGLVPMRDSVRVSRRGNEAEDTHGSRSESGAQ
jgi:hypothetical protein